MGRRNGNYALDETIILNSKRTGRKGELYVVSFRGGGRDNDFRGGLT